MHRAWAGALTHADSDTTLIRMLIIMRVTEMAKWLHAHTAN